VKAVERAGGRSGGGEKGVAGEKGDLGKAEMLKGRMLRWTPVFDGIGRILNDFHFSLA
jgi:hypothetical protein